MTLQVSLVFSTYFGERAWSEVHYTTDDGFTRWLTFVGTSGPISTPLLEEFISKRRRLIAFQADPARVDENVFLRKIRFSLIGANRKSYTYYLPSTMQSGLFGTDTPPVESFTRLLTRIDTTTDRAGKIWLSGVPESQLRPPNLYFPAGNFPDRLDEYALFLTSNGFAIRSRIQPDPASPSVPITRLLLDAGGRTATLAPGRIATGLVAPPLRGQIIIRGRHPSEWNGIHRYIYDDVANALSLGPARQPLGDFVLGAGGGGEVQLYLPQYPFVRGLVPLRFESRDTGGPFVRFRGRRRRSV